MTSSTVARARTEVDSVVRGEEEQLVVFDLCHEDYGVDISVVREIIRMQPITRVPRAPCFVEGLINLRGRVIPVVDLRKRFELEAGHDEKNNRIVVVNVGNQDIGMVVDGVTEVLRIPSDCIEPPSAIITNVESEYLVGIAKLSSRLIILLDLEKVLTNTEKGELVGMSLSDARIGNDGESG
ncbi:MAG: chemotaxis protein CheW [Chloroflexota bacterium]|nr:chemotaxis protein CheW [Chloroflexota bacterium]